MYWNKFVAQCDEKKLSALYYIDRADTICDCSSTNCWSLIRNRNKFDYDNYGTKSGMPLLDDYNQEIIIIVSCLLTCLVLVCRQEETD